MTLYLIRRKNSRNSPSFLCLSTEKRPIWSCISSFMSDTPIIFETEQAARRKIAELEKLYDTAKYSFSLKIESRKWWE